jgi:hypothetical protein
MRLQNYLNEAVPISIMRQFKDIILSGKHKSYMNNIFKGKDRLYLPLKGQKLVEKAPKEIENFLRNKGYEGVDYIGGIAKNNKGRLIKIGKILNNEGQTELLKIFQSDKSISSGKEKKRLILYWLKYY